MPLRDVDESRTIRSHRARGSSHEEELSRSRRDARLLRGCDLQWFAAADDANEHPESADDFYTSAGPRDRVTSDHFFGDFVVGAAAPAFAAPQLRRGRPSGRMCT